MATDVEERFQGPLVLDGGMATELERGGADLRDALWSARLLKDDPGSIRRVHEAFFDAGADVAISASYQASFSGFADRGIEAEEAASLMRLSVALAREAAAADGSDRLVAASVGPFGATLADGSEYRGDYGLSAGALAMFHRPRFETLLEAEPDLLAIETIPSIVEAEALVTLLEDYSEARAWISFSCRDGACISDGTPFADAVALAASSDRVIAVGVNCTPPGFIPSLLDGAEVDETTPRVPERRLDVGRRIEVLDPGRRTAGPGRVRRYVAVGGRHDRRRMLRHHAGRHPRDRRLGLTGFTPRGGCGSPGSAPSRVRAHGGAFDARSRSTDLVGSPLSVARAWPPAGPPRTARRLRPMPHARRARLSRHRG